MTSQNWFQWVTVWALVGVVMLFCAPGSQEAFSQEDAPIEIVVERDTAFFDRKVGLQVRGLNPSSETIITVSTSDARGQSWWSQNVYVADKNGQVDPSRQEPIRGTYSSTHPMGPFWSMIGAERFYTSSSAEVHIRVSNQEGGLAERTVIWLSPRDHPDVIKETIRRSDFVADLYLPRDRQGSVPAVVVVGGSGGGYNSERASLLATHGYAALDVAYFGVEGTPKYFVETMPLEYFKGAISFLEGDPRIDVSRIAMMGRSYGAQLALLLASHEPRIHLVIAEAPSSFTTGTPATYPVGPVLSAWSLEGEAFPFLNAQDEGNGPVSPKQITVSTSGEVALEQVPAAKRAAIPVERMNGPVLLISGEEDNIWPSTVMAEQLIRRMEAQEFEHAARHVHYPDAGHNMGGGQQAYGVPNLPPKDRGGSSGGTRQGSSVAGVAAWAEVLAFLRSHLR